MTSSYLEGEQNACGAYGYDRDGKKGKKQIVIGLLLEAGVLQMDLFDAAVCEVQQEGLRYVLRRNPLRAEQLAASRTDKQARLERLRADRNRYLAEHPRAKVTTGEKALRAKIAQLKIKAWLAVEAEGRTLKLTVNQPALEEASRLDGCYAIKTDLPERAASKQVVHDRYRDLAEVEQAFRTCKTAHLETRPRGKRDPTASRRCCRNRLFPSRPWPRFSA